jgi:hypothetical protein
MGKMVYISKRDLEIFELLEGIFTEYVYAGAEFTEEQKKAVGILDAKMHGRKVSK